MGELTNFMNEIACKYEDLWCDKDVQPKISVIVPAYNVEKYIEECLLSLLQQTFKDFEVIIINDGSTDLTPEIANVFQHCDTRIKLINQENKGLSGARNTGLAYAQGEYITFLDSDDWVSQNYLEDLYNAIVKNNCDIAIATIVRKREYSQKYRVHYTEEKIYTDLQEKLEICGIPKCCYVWNKLYRASLIKNKMFQEGKYFEDILWIPEVIKESNRLVTVSNICHFYRATKGSIVKKNSSKKQNDSYNAKKYIIQFFGENGLSLPQKNKTLTKQIQYFCNIPYLKVKEFLGTETYLLFGIFKLFSKKEAQNRCIYNILGLKFTIRKNKISDKEYIEMNYDYENNRGEGPNVKTKYETLDELLNTNKSMARYGDGEFNLIFGEDLPFQNNSAELSKRLKEILINNDEKILVCVPDIFSSLQQYNANATRFWRKFVVTNRNNVYSYLNFETQYYDSLMSRPYMDLADKSRVKEYFDKFKNLWANREVVIVEGVASRLGVGNDLFDNVKSVSRILCPAQNAYEKYDVILDECKKQSKDKLFILALGPTATVLAYDLSKFGYRALDLGHVDIEYEWFLKGVTKKVPIKNKYVNENKKGREITSIQDDKYNSEIIFDCSKELR